MMYLLYINRKTNEIKVSKAHKAMQNLTYPEDVSWYNNCYLICKTRKPLVEKAKEIKQQWIDELEHELQLIKDIKPQ